MSLPLPFPARRSTALIELTDALVVFAVAASNLEDAWRKFHSSPRASTAILFVIQTETSIFLATPA